MPELQRAPVQWAHHRDYQPFLQTRKLKLRKVKRLAQVPTPSDWQSLSWNTHQPDSKVHDLSQQHTAARVCFKFLDQDVQRGRVENMHGHQEVFSFQRLQFGKDVI